MKKNRCDLIPDAPEVVVRRSAAIGDALAATVVADKIIERGYNVVFQSQPGIHCVLRRHPGIISIEEPKSACHVNLDDCYERDPQRKTRHFSDMFMARANEQLRARGIYLGEARNCAPTLVFKTGEKDRASDLLGKYPKPWIFICPRSNSWAARTVPDGIWSQAALGMTGTKFWLGTHPGPPHIVDLQVRHFDNVIHWLAAADLLVTVDTGPLHVAAALGVPCLALGQASSPDLHLSDQRDFQTIWPEGLGCLNCQQNICPKNQYQPPCQSFKPEKIAEAVNKRFATKISAAIAVYQPDAWILNRCLESILPQVDEIVICRDQAGKFPLGAMKHAKIRYVVKQAHDLGYAKKMNFAIRHTNAPWVLCINDDAFLAPDAVGRMMELSADPTVGLIAPITRMSNGRIYHAGKRRGPGQRGWGHIDQNVYECSIKEVTELENICGCVTLTRRAAHFDCLGFDEDYKLFCDDDDLCMRIRRNGWRILFTPFAQGIHEEHHSINKTHNWVAEMHKSQKIFGEKWGAYWDHNANRLPLGNFDYMKA